MQIIIRETDRVAISALRNQYLDGLPYSQEYFLEDKVKAGSTFSIYVDERLAGYYVLDASILVEFFLLGPFKAYSSEIFEAVLKHSKVAKVYCKSFDSLLMKCCMRRQMTYKTGGILFREYASDFATIGGADKFSVRFAEASDFDRLKKFDDLSDSEDELRAMLDGKNLNLFYLDDELVGCGYFFQIVPGRNYCDIGMWVNPAHRRQGHAVDIINFQKRFCLENDLVPVCGCSGDNLASKKVLEKCGFVSSHDLILFSI